MKRCLRLAIAALPVLALTVTALAQQAAADTTNLIRNPSAETLNAGQPANWTADSWGTSSTTMQPTSDAHTGSVALNVTTTTRTSGDAKWVPDSVDVTGGQEYTYSDYYKATVGTELDVAYTDASGTVTYAYLGAVNPASGWQLATSTFTVPASATKAAVLHILATAGSLTIDDASLASTVAPPVTPPSTGVNLIANPSFETANGATPAAWQTGSWGTNDASFTYEATGHTGSRSASVRITTYTDGDAKWYANPVAVTAGQQYAYSDSYQSPVVTRVVAAYTTGSSTTYIELPQAPAAANWSTYTTTLTAPAGAVDVTIFHLLDKAGSLTIDDVSLVAGDSTPSPTPLDIANPSVEMSSDGTVPDGWQHSAWGTNTESFTYENDGHTGAKSVKTTVTSYTDGDAKWYFNPVTGLQDGQSYHFSAWLKSNTQPHAVADFTMADGTDVYASLSMPSANATNWQQYTADFTAPSGATAVTVFLLLSSTGWVETDDYALATYTPVGFSEGLVSLDFDDGWRNIYNNGLPLLQKYGLPSTQYIISGNIGAAGYMTQAQISAFQTAGSEIGSHTVTHPDLTTLTAAQLQSELLDSQTTLRQLFGASVATEFASPYGAYNDTVIAAIKPYYVSHRSTDVGFNSKDNFNPYNIVVQNVTATTSNAQVEAWIDQAKAQKTWLVLVYHQVENQVAAADTDAVKTADLDVQLSYLKASGITVKTQSAALSEVTAQQ
ncbi:MAG: polysaccharide deacetylase family protein [Mycobacterium sp.]|nr:polysaccharide deacetylase family protein [Mycobacterium sp.]